MGEGSAEVAQNLGSFRKMTSFSPPLPVASYPPATQAFAHFKALALLLSVWHTLFHVLPWLAAFLSSEHSLYKVCLEKIQPLL